MYSFLKIAILCALTASFSVSVPADSFAQSKKEKRQAKEKAPPPPPVIQIPPDVKSRPIEIDKIVMRVPGNAAIGSYGEGLLCQERETLRLRGGVFSVDDPAYADRLRADLQAVNYNVVGNPTALFKDKDAGKAEVLIGVVIKSVKADLCGGITVFESDIDGKGQMDVEWQVYDTLKREVVVTKSTQGKSKVNGMRPGTEETVLIEAFSDAARQFLTDPSLSQIVLPEGAGDVVASLSDAPGTAIAATTISRLPLSKRPFQEFATDARGNVVTIFTGGGSGSGFFVSDRHVITNAHVVQAAKFVKLKLITGREILGEVLAFDDKHDVALIQAETAGYAGLAIRTDEIGIGSAVFAIGSPLGEGNEGTVSAGIISSYRTENGVRYIQSDVNVIPGNSGGPLLDDRGNVIGLTSWGKLDPRSGGTTGLNFFIPINDAMAKLGLQFR
jgi:S1-C subfamily serine protease